MPNYEVEHSIPLQQEQQDALAEAITRIHCKTFNALPIFVNIRFTHVGNQTLYIAAKRCNVNRIFATVRTGPARKQSDYDNVCTQIHAAWQSIVGSVDSEDRELRAIFVLGGVLSASEAGFLLPEAGGDAQWVRDNMDEFKKRAEAGDEDFAELLRDMKV